MKTGLPARSDVADQHSGYRPNPNRLANPFSPTSEPDWILVDNRQSTQPVSRAAAPVKKTVDQPGITTVSRSPSSASTVASTLRKAPPPVPRKPIALSDNTSPPLPQRSNSVIEKGYSPAVQWNTSTNDRPNLPIRPAHTFSQGTTPQTPNNFLMDVMDDEQVSSIPALLPRRPET